MREKISVAMATYNGEKYIKEQIASILCNLSEEDELIVSDDGSKDRTREIVSSFNDKRILLCEGPRQGVKKNFENAIRHCNGRYIFLSDQDDVWHNDKVEKVLEAFYTTGAVVIVHNCALIDGEGGKLMDSFFEYRNSGAGYFKNIWKNTYVGCCMAFDSCIKEKILPIPGDIEMHDQWIGLIGEKSGGSKFIDEKLIDFRRHGDNASNPFKHHGIGKMIKNRVKLLVNLATRKV